METSDWEKFAKKIGRRVDSISKLCDELVEAEQEAEVLNFLLDALGQLLFAERFAKVRAGIEPQNPIKRMKQVTLTMIDSDGRRVLVSGMSAKHEKGLSWTIIPRLSEMGMALPRFDKLDVEVAQAVSASVQEFLGVRL